MTKTEITVPAGRWRQLLEEAPEAAKAITQIVLDNPVPLTLTFAGSIVVAKILANAVRPRGTVEGLSTFLVAWALCAGGAAELTRRGILNFRVRDDDGCLVPLRDARAL